MTMTMPQFLLGHYMRLSMDEAGLSVEHMAEQLGVSRTTVSRWLNNRSVPRPGDLALWAQLTHVSTEWLGSAPVARPEGLEPPTFWLVAEHGSDACPWCAETALGDSDCSCECHTGGGDLDARIADWRGWLGILDQLRPARTEH